MINGVIVKGKGASADLVLLDANPLDNIKNISQINGVMVRDQWWSRDRIDAQFAVLAEEYAADERALNETKPGMNQKESPLAE